MNNKEINIKITNPEKIIYKEINITKLDVIKYYKTVAEMMLPYVKNRPLSVIRCHDGVDKECFFKKHAQTEKEHVKTFMREGKEYFYITTQKELLYQAQFGTIEFHTSGAEISSLTKPNTMVFDLDPDENMNINKLREGVLLLKEVLDDIGLTSFLKTSGGKGYHIVVPFKESSNWDMFFNFANNVALILEKKYPSMFTTNIRKQNRKGKIFIDYLRNGETSTCVAPYSLRARAGATISMPIKWSDLDKIAPNDVNILNYKEFIKKANPWKNFFNINQKLY